MNTKIIYQNKKTQSDYPYPISCISQFIVDQLIQLYVDAVFGVSGANIEDIFFRFAQQTNKVKTVVAKHEFSAVAMADAYYRITGRFGVVLTTSGGGALNIIPAVAESYSAGIPMLLLVGQIPSHREGTGMFQDMSSGCRVDALRLYKSVCKAVYKIDDPEELLADFVGICRSAYSYPSGPIVLLLPKDLQQAQIACPVKKASVMPVDKLAVEENVSHYHRHLDALICCIRAATRIAVIVGPEVLTANAKQLLQELVEYIDAAVVCAPDAKASFDNFSSRYFGVVGIMGDARAVEAIRACDLCLAVGTSLPSVTRGGIEEIIRNKSLFHIGVQELFLDLSHLNPGLCQIGLNVEIALRALVQSMVDKKSFCLDATVPASSSAGNALSVNRIYNSFTYKNIISILQPCIESDANVVIDAGNSGAFAIHHLKLRRTNNYFVALHMGGMGYSFGAAIGACIANRCRTYVLSGDGSFLMHGQEVHTAVQLNLPIVFIIFNNNAHDMCRVRERMLFGKEYTENKFLPTNIGRGMYGMYPGLLAFDVDDCVALTRILKSVKRQAGPVVLSLNISDDTPPPYLALAQPGHV